MAFFKSLRTGARCCGARTRKGTPCQRLLLLKGRKCPNHGGMSLNKADKARITAATGRQFKKTGPATPEGKARSFAARDAGRDRYWRERRISRLAGLAGGTLGLGESA